MYMWYSSTAVYVHVVYIYSSICTSHINNMYMCTFRVVHVHHINYNVLTSTLAHFMYIIMFRPHVCTRIYGV